MEAVETVFPGETERMSRMSLIEEGPSIVPSSHAPLLASVRVADAELNFFFQATRSRSGWRTWRSSVPTRLAMNLGAC
jgi:hypothetical protein